ncbi:Alpha/Beta hydrolase protein [Poronia punctata]|nr:Alpha/Beta hydrolase protein [Poronia punctata]
MILGPVSYLDCAVFCIFLTPQLLLQVGVFETISVVIQCLPFLLVQLPFGFIRERYLSRRADQPLFVQQASPFEDFVIRCVRHAFANVDPKVGRVFFSKPVTLPFLRFRMLRHGHFKFPVHWHEHRGENFRGIWIVHNPKKQPDLCLYYAHGGGFSMGSSYFYLEFLLSWLDLLKKAGYENPSIFALEYSLVPDNTFPKQLDEAVAGYEHVLSTVGSPGRVCVGGDSAGGTIVLTLLLHLANPNYKAGLVKGYGDRHLGKPAFAVLISPWVTLLSEKHRNTESDYLDARSLHAYARRYSGDYAPSDPLVSPGRCKDAVWWHEACPLRGIHLEYGTEEVFAPDIEDLVRFWDKNGIEVSSRGHRGGIHAWPVASLFLSDDPKRRLDGLNSIVQEIRSKI